MPCLRRALRTVKSEPETCELDEDGGDSIRNSERGDLNSCDMTLKELQECCKRRKKKLRKSDGSSRKDASPGDNSSKQSCPSLRVKEEETDLEEPIISWKLKLSNNARVKKNSSGKRVRLSSKTSVSAGKTPSASQDLPLDVRGMQTPIKIKIEISKPELANVSNGTESEYSDDIGLHREFSDTDEVHEVDNRCEIGSMEPDFACISNDSTHECCDKIDFCQESFSTEPTILTRGDTESLEHTSLTKESQNCVINEASFEYSELGGSPSAPLSGEMIFVENLETGFPQMTSHGSFSFSTFEDTREGNITHQLPSYSVSEKNPFTNNLIQDMPNSVDSPGTINTHSFTEHTCQMNRNLTQLPVAANDELHCIEHNCSNNRCASDFESEAINSGENPHLKENSTCNSESPTISFQDSQPSSNADSNADPLCNGSPTSLEKYSFLTTDGSVNAGVDGTLDCSMKTLGSDVSEGLTAMEVLENHRLHLRSPPKRLLLKRKAISPTSQEKLCNAMSDELYDNAEHFKSGLHEFEVTLSPMQVVKKPKNRRNGSPQSVPKGILKASRSFLVPHEGTDGTSINTHAHKAIAFSQRQMHDIECLAMKLLKELKFMKEIMEETWHSNGCSSIPSKYTPDELRLTIENAGEVEETTKKWLSMMARDCNRFCKIMRSAEKTAVASGYDVHKERKKITFADEAGGMLCHVKVFEDHPAPSLVIKSQNTDAGTQVNQD